MTTKNDDLSAALILAAQALSNVANAMKSERVSISRTRSRTSSAAPISKGDSVVEVPTGPITLRDRIEIALTRESLDTNRLSKALGESVDTVNSMIKGLRAEGKIANVAMGDSTPIWMWRIGNETDTPTLRTVMKRLISERGMYLRELVQATGAKESRVSGVMVELQRTGGVIDLSGGQGHARCYFLPVAGSHMTDGHDPGGKTISLKPRSLKPRPTTRAARSSKK